MKRLSMLWPHIVAFDNLYRAWRKARKGKSHTAAVADFELGLEHHLLALQGELLNGIYQPGEYRLFTIYERKPRVIAAAPFRDRVVHHALMNIIEPPLDRRFVFDCYACRTAKGTHAAVDRYQHWACRYRYVLKLDVRQYFPSIDHEYLKAKLQARIKDRDAIALLDCIIDAGPNRDGKGIPIGNLTSQFFANLYLDDFDHWIKETLRAPAYLRYVDDMVLLGDDKRQLANWREHIRERLQHERLQLHPNKAHISPTRCGLNLLGYVVYPTHRRLRADNGYRFRRKLRSLARLYQQGVLVLADIDPSVQAWLGHAQHADTKGLRQAIFNQVCFTRGVGQTVPSG